MAINQWWKKMGKKPIRGRRNNFNGNGNSSNDIKCYNCNKLGHISKNCNAPRRSQSDRSKTNNVKKKTEDHKLMLSTQFRKEITWIFGRGRD
jgi:hypothetical protein